MNNKKRGEKFRKKAEVLQAEGRRAVKRQKAEVYRQKQKDAEAEVEIVRGALQVKS